LLTSGATGVVELAGGNVAGGESIDDGVGAGVELGTEWIGPLGCSDSTDRPGRFGTVSRVEMFDAGPDGLSSNFGGTAGADAVGGCGAAGGGASRSDASVEVGIVVV
jgi:hypothetical protein